jgi:hypothetical protein
MTLPSPHLLIQQHRPSPAYHQLLDELEAEVEELKRENKLASGIVAAMCAHCKQTLYRELPHGDLVHATPDASGCLKTCCKESGVY